MKPFVLPYNLYRFMGITGLFLIGYIVMIGIFGNTDISQLLPNDFARTVQVHWPDMPFFKAQSQMIDDGNGPEKETFYTVPTRQITPQELAALKATGPEPAAAQKPKDANTPAAHQK